MQFSHPNAAHKYSSGIFESCHISPQHLWTSNNTCSQPPANASIVLPSFLTSASSISPAVHMFSFFPSSGATIESIQTTFTSAIMWPYNKALKHMCSLCRRHTGYWTCQKYTTQNVGIPPKMLLYCNQTPIEIKVSSVIWNNQRLTKAYNLAQIMNENSEIVIVESFQKAHYSFN